MFKNIWHTTKKSETSTVEAKEIIALKTSHISFVKNPATGFGFLATKSDDGTVSYELVTEKLIFKSDNEERLVTGIVYSPNTLDLQNEFASAEVIRKSAYSFLKDFGNVDQEHNWIDGSGSVVESYITKSDEVIEGVEVKKGTWLVTIEASEETWESVKKGDFTGFSLGGKSITVDSVVNVDSQKNVTTKSVKEQMFEFGEKLFGKSFTEKVLEKMETVQKDFNKTLDNKLNTDILFYMYILEDVIYDACWSVQTSEEYKTLAIESATQFLEKLNAMSGVTKSINIETKQVTVDEIKELIKKSLDNFVTKEELVKTSNDIIEVIDNVAKLSSDNILEVKKGMLVSNQATPTIKSAQKNNNNTPKVYNLIERGFNSKSEE